MAELGRGGKYILAGTMILGAVLGGALGYENYHTIGAAVVFGTIGGAAVLFGTLRAIG